MGRAERRRKERFDRLASRKDSVLMGKDELHAMRKNIVDRTSKYDVEALMTCFALAEHRLYGFGPTRIMRSLEYIDKLMGDVLNDSKTMEDYKRELEEEVGVAIRF